VKERSIEEEEEPFIRQAEKSKMVSKRMSERKNFIMLTNIESETTRSLRSLNTSVPHTVLENILAKKHSKKVPVQDFHLYDRELLPERMSVDVDALKTSITGRLQRSALFDLKLADDTNIAKISLNLYPLTDLFVYREKIKKRILDVKILADEVIEAHISMLVKRHLDTDVNLEMIGIRSGRIGVGRGLLLFERFIGVKMGAFPRSFGESANAPIIVIIREGEDKPWHCPIMFALKELFRELSDRHPRIVFRTSEEEVEAEVEAIVDSIEPHSLEDFTFSNRIEMVYLKRYPEFFEDFVNTIPGKLKSAYLQDFGVLAIVVGRETSEEGEIVEKLWDVISDGTGKSAGVKIIECDPDDRLFEYFCSALLGICDKNEVFEINDFLKAIEQYNDCLRRVVRDYSIFVNRQGDYDEIRAKERYHYALKTATLSCLLNSVINEVFGIEEWEEEDIVDFLVKKVKEGSNVTLKFDIGKIEVNNGEIEIITEGEIKIRDDSGTGGSGETADIIIKRRRGDEKESYEYIEVETLIGTLEPMKKIDETIQKYYEDNAKGYIIAKNSGKGKLIIVLRPVSALFHYEELMRRKKFFDKVMNINVEFQVLVLERIKDEKSNREMFYWKLVPLEDYMKKFIELLKEMGR